MFLKVLESLKVSDKGLEIVQNQIKQKIQEQNMYNEDRIKEVQKKIDLVKSRLNKMFELYLDGNLEESFYNSKRDEFQLELDSLNSQLLHYNRGTENVVDFSKKYSNSLKTHRDFICPVQ